MHHFTDESLLGAPLPSVSDIPEYLLELNVLPNRPDFLGLIGIAREVAALLRLELLYPATYAESGAGAIAPVAVDIREPELCTRYQCGVIGDVRVAPSPPWLKARLLLAGMRPINNVVDITNYVLYEWGQPLHAFDFHKVAGSKVVVRRMAEGETIELLSGAIVGAHGQAGGKRLAAPPLVIADRERPLALAGVMGGRFAETAEATTEVLIEAAHFDPVLIRQTAQQVDLGTESRGTAASYRFERGTDPNSMLEGALARAVHLVAEVAHGKPRGRLVDCYPQHRDRRTFRVSPVRTSSCLGIDVSAATITDCLTRLGMTCTGDEREVQVTVPTWRADINDPVVLIEDVARMIGYDEVPVAPRPSLPTVGLRCVTDRLRQVVSDHLVSAGFFESRNPSLESPKSSAWLGECGDPVALSNWATREMSVLRRSLLPGLAATVQTNVRRGAQAVWFFEVDRVFGGSEAEGTGAMSGKWHVAGMAGGRLHRSNWRTDGTHVDLFTLKGIVEDLLERIGFPDATFLPADRQPFVAGTAAEITLATDRPLGLIGEIDPKTVVFERVPFRVFAFELDLEMLEGRFQAMPSFEQLLRQPAVTRDLAVVVRVTVSYAAIVEALQAVAGPMLESIRLVDQYQGAQVAPGHQSLAFHMLFRDPELTLTAEQVAETMERIVADLKHRFGAELRA
jgi:phenylalanyl-tRNA synthetase beta chain